MKEFDEAVKINRFKLEVECEQHASIYLQYATEYAEAQSELDKAENALKLVMAETDLAIRECSEKKPTESAITSMVLTNDNVKKARKRVEMAQEQSFLSNAQVRAFEHRKSMLDNIIVLWSKGYYATPDGGKRANEEVASEVRKNMRGRNQYED